MVLKSHENGANVVLFLGEPRGVKRSGHAHISRGRFLCERHRGGRKREVQTEAVQKRVQASCRQGRLHPEDLIRCTYPMTASDSTRQVGRKWELFDIRHEREKRNIEYLQKRIWMNEWKKDGKRQTIGRWMFSMHPGNRMSCKQPSVSLLQEADRMQWEKAVI